MSTAEAGILSFETPSAIFARIRRDAGNGRIEELLNEECAAGAEAPATESDNWRSACGRLAARTRFRGPVTLLLPAHLLLARHVDLPGVTGARREKALRFAAAQAIPWPLAEVVWDGVTANASSTGENVLLLAARREPVERLCAAAEAAGFEAASVLPAPLASLAAHRLVDGGDRPAGLLLILGAKSHELVLVEPESFRLRIFAARGRVEERDGVAWLAAEIGRTLRHFQTEGSSVFTRPAVVRLAGATVPPELAAELSSLLGIPVEQRLIAPGGPASGDEVPEVLRWRLMGAAATAFRAERPRGELLPAPRLERRRRVRRRPWIVGAALLTLAAMLPPIVHHRAETESLGQQRARLDAELAEPRARDAHNRAQLARLAELRRQTVALDELMERRDWWVGLLAELQERFGRVEDVWLDRLEVLAADPNDETAGKPRLRLVLSGRMLDRTSPWDRSSPKAYERMKALLASLAASSFVAAVQGERIDRVQPGIVRFELEIVADANRAL